jgi:heat shock protein HspQ
MHQDRDISNLLKLLDAESDQVRNQVQQALMAFGDTLDQYIERHRPSLSPEQQYALSQLRESRQIATAQTQWMSWLSAGSPAEQIEAATTHLANIYQSEHEYPPLGDLLDDLAEEFTLSSKQSHALDLNRFLFTEGRLKGAVEDYYHPRNSHLPSVILKGEGLPISLVLVYIMVSRRLGFDVRGFNLPGHFLAAVPYGGEYKVIDCFDRGNILDKESLRQQLTHSHINLEGLLKCPPQPTDIIRRVLLNMLNAYRTVADQNQFEVYRSLLKQLNEHVRDLEEAALPPDNVPNFKPGDLIRHVRYGYRGIVVEVNQTCRATEEWYRASVVRPSRKQPWYHILVDCSDTTTYAAQSSIMPNDEGSEIQHPLIHMYFDRLKGGTYQRNDVPWNPS